jgi:phosphatidylglycerol:prolipoprotein diacylglycerol transferase
MYVGALLGALFIARWFIKKDNLPITNDELDTFFLYAEVGVILGARLGYVLFYMPNNEYFLTHPWQMFNPFVNGQFVGLSGFSYHGAIIGFVLATWVFTLRNKKFSFLFMMDLVAISVPLAFTLGRIGNFLNQELYGRVTDVPWAIYVNGAMRHPSQLYEAFLEGILLFIILYYARTKKSFDGQLIFVYGVGYSITRYIAEMYRQPDFQLGFIWNGFTMGQLLSMGMIVASFALLYFGYKEHKKVQA